MRYPSIPEEERRLAEDLLFNRGEDPVAAFADYFKAKGAAPKAPTRARRHAARAAAALHHRGLEGRPRRRPRGRARGRHGAARHHQRPAHGRHGRGRPALQRQRADRRRGAAVGRGDEGRRLPPRAVHGEGRRLAQGKIILATVKGDVHDIGKNLVEIILSNNGYEVVNLGIKVPPEELIAAYDEHQPDVIGLSGLLVKSAQQMVTTAEDLTAAGVDGADPGRRRGAHPEVHGHRIAPAYGGLARLRRGRDERPRPRRPDLSGDEARERARRGVAEAPGGRRSRDVRSDQEIPLAAPAVRSPEVAVVEAHAGAPTCRGTRPRASSISTEVWKYLNPQMLYAKHLGLRGSYCEAEGGRRPQARRARARRSRRVQATPAGSRRARCTASSGATSEGNTLHLLVPGGGEACFTFPRQVAGETAVPRRLRPPARQRRGAAGPTRSRFFVTTAGEGMRAARRGAEGRGASTCAATRSRPSPSRPPRPPPSGCTAKLARAWGFPDPPETTMLDRFQGRYRGKRYSFGYPACPELEDQATLFRLLDGRQDRRRAHRGLHDGSRGVRLGARPPPPAGALLRRPESRFPPEPIWLEWVKSIDPLS